jgi:Valyl-tRNA synthetase
VSKHQLSFLRALLCYPYFGVFPIHVVFCTNKNEFSEEDGRKLETLEGLLERLEQGLARLEEENKKLKGQQSGEADERDPSVIVKEMEQQKAILLAQVEKLEAQVEKVREVSVLDKQAAKVAQDKLWKACACFIEMKMLLLLERK